MNPPDPVRAALQALLDWGREHTGPNQPDNPHDLLVAAQAALAVPMPTPPAPAPRQWMVTGTAHYADGFDLIVEADSREEAEEAVEQLVRTGNYDKNPEIQEVCIQSASPIEDD